MKTDFALVQVLVGCIVCGKTSVLLLEREVYLHSFNHVSKYHDLVKSLPYSQQEISMLQFGRCSSLRCLKF